VLYKENMTMKKIEKQTNKFNYKWNDTSVIAIENYLEIEGFINSKLNYIHDKFEKSVIYNSLNKYFFFTGMDFEDLFSAKQYLDYSFNNVKRLEKDLQEQNEQIEVELKEINFNKDLSINTSMILYWGDYTFNVQQSKNEVRINSF
jgi:hypothetical protein